MSALFTKKQREDPVRADLIRELVQVQEDIEDARKRFNQATEQELIEQTVFELSALQARYAYFLRLMREHDGIGDTAAEGGESSEACLEAAD